MLEVAPAQIQGTPWEPNANGLGISDCEGHHLYSGNLWFGPDSFDERLAVAKERTANVCRAVNMHLVLCNRLAEMIAVASELYRRVDWDKEGSINSHRFREAIELAARTLEKVR